MLSKVEEQQAETAVAFAEGWEGIDALELDLAQQLGFETVAELEVLLHDTPTSRRR